MQDPSCALVLAGRTDRLSIGLTGGIGSGKSTVARLLEARGAGVIDTDEIARALTRSSGQAIPALRKTFGDDIILPDGGLDRSRMRQLAFGDVSVRHQLESVLHPLVMHEAGRQATALRSMAVLVFDVPLLIESAGWRRRVDRVLVVDCSEQTQLNRVMARSAWSAETARAVMLAQASRAERLQAADDVILNDGLTPEQLESAVDALWTRWQGLIRAAL
jgi:dephospho-CoA kinase